MENNYRLMNLKQEPKLLEQIQKWERELHEKTGSHVALIAYEEKQTEQLHKKERE
ncbi:MULTISPECIES: hypothetical protein [Thermoactinomyces]|uniref:Uncharacterized protein n=1 Tax=Thermoactinomyces vulgaris TaxID=2026 RepID=A0ABS0QI09_THEVU|nr:MULTISPECIES: hypothetical protein [Thermoactinomyces]MBA4551744.1 hypothetical protein [Thermoactinomyces vulgaris]MBA4596377.1 hypothetical protein [Thermoactinomyces vulgaris]MBH8582892.1 hypothetical protein [Thermoactinomyces sp. CICC 10735]MBH8585682.1 hypothetical protein [Thermoactinomyces sp. CICC 10520]MBH8588914.1 hypothetical protein [Thermoactinomyces vulgaris]